MFLFWVFFKTGGVEGPLLSLEAAEKACTWQEDQIVRVDGTAFEPRTWLNKRMAERSEKESAGQ